MLIQMQWVPKLSNGASSSASMATSCAQQVPDGIVKCLSHTATLNISKDTLPRKEKQKTLKTEDA